MVDKLIPIPVPLRGLNTVEPDLPIDAMYARELTNLLIVNGRLRQRPSIGIWNDFGNSSFIPLWWDSAYAFMAGNPGTIVQISDNTVVKTFEIGDDTTNTISPLLVKHDSISLVIGIGPPREPELPFDEWNFTTIGIVDREIVAATSHKGRLYVSAGTVIEYSNVAAVSGAMADDFDVAEFTNNEAVEYLYSFNTQPGQSNDENVLVIITENFILVYAGDFPGSQTWNLIAKFGIGSTRNLVREVEGDLFIATPSLCYYLSDLFQKGVSEVTKNPRNAAIKNLWQEQVWKFNLSVRSAQVPHLWYHDELDIVVCSCFQTRLDPYFGEYNEQVSFVYHRRYDAWSVWDGLPFYSPVIKIDGDYTAAQSNRTIAVLLKDDFDFTTGITQKIEMSWKTPFVQPFRGQLQQVQGVRPRWRYKRTLKETGGDTQNTTATLEVVRSIFDYTDYVVSSDGTPVSNVWPFYQQGSATEPIVNPENYAELSIDIVANTSGNYTPFAGLNGIGEGVGLHIVKKNDVDDPEDPDYLQTSETELEIYGATIYAKDGGIIF